MSRKSSKKAAKPLGPEQATGQTGAAYPVEPAELDAQNARLKKAAAAGAGALKTSPAAQPPTETPHAAPTGSTTARENSGSEPAVQPRNVQSASIPVAPPASPVSEEKQAPAPPQTASAQTPQTSGPQKANITFVLLEPNAKHVSVRGDFNAWSAEGTPMKRQPDGRWEASVALAPGRYEYKFFVDGQWVPDPLARENVWNYHGTLNSVLVV